MGLFRALFTGWRYHGRKSKKAGPIRVTMIRNGFFTMPKFSWGIWTKYYKYDPKSGRHSINTPGMGGLKKKGRRRTTRRKRR